MNFSLVNSWKTRAHNAIETGYSAAISAYEEQKNNFIKQLNSASNISADDFIKELNDEALQETDKELFPIFDKAFQEVDILFEEFFLNKILNDSNFKNGYNQIVEKYNKIVEQGLDGSRSQEKPIDAYKRLRDSISKLLKEHGLDGAEIAKTVAMNTSLKNNNVKIQEQLFGYARKLLLNYASNGAYNFETTHFKQAMKGFYREKALEEPFQRVLRRYGMDAVQSGQELNEKGQQIKYDIMIGTAISQKNSDELQKIVKNITSIKNISENENVNSSFVGGVQVKSWSLPWDLNKSPHGNTWRLSFGNSSNLLPKGEDFYYWHAGVYNVMSNLEEAIGEYNFLFSTGDSVLWTAELLSQFRQNNYVLAFGWAKNKNKGYGSIAGGDVLGLPHKDDSSWRLKG